MKLIENKKLFGKITIFDIVIVLVFLAVLFVMYNYLYGASGSKIGGEYFTTACQIKLDNMPVGVSEKIKEGDLIYDNETNAYIGKVISAEKRDYIRIVENLEKGEYSEAVIPNRESVVLKVEVSVNDADADLITANNYYIKVGKELYVRGPSYAGGGYIITIDR